MKLKIFAMSTLLCLLGQSVTEAQAPQVVKDIVAGSQASFPKNLFNNNGQLYFCATDQVHGYELWKSDGTEEGTVMVKDAIEGIPFRSTNSLFDF